MAGGCFLIVGAYQALEQDFNAGLNTSKRPDH
jgi:hypothetical protein